jgi:hypothetical protein
VGWLELELRDGERRRRIEGQECEIRAEGTARTGFDAVVVEDT